MFLRMFRNDLKQKKSLNVILVVFMIAASIMVFAGSVTLYSLLTGETYMKKMCNLPNANFGILTSDGTWERDLDKAKEILNGSDLVKWTEADRAIPVKAEWIDFDNYEESEDDQFFERNFYLMKQPRKADLVFDQDDKPFSVENGKIYLPIRVGELSGAKKGDKVKISTAMGRTYEFEIAGFYKEVTYSRLRLIVSDSDFEYLTQENPRQFLMTSVELTSNDPITLNKLRTLLADNDILTNYYSNNGMSSDEMLMYILSMFISVAAIFMILIIFMTIRFTMVSAIKDEEKEIGTLRAIGADTPGFRWLFAAKYIVFAIVGGTLGVAAGFPVATVFMQKFTSNMLFPSIATKIVIGSIAVVVTVLIMIAFCMLVMRRIDKISVIDAIHGESGGERFGKSSVIFLHKRKKMKLPSYLALSDILKKFRRYAFLTVGFTLGVIILLLSFYLDKSLNSLDFMQYYGLYKVDFYPDFNNEMTAEYQDRAVQENTDFWTIINNELEEHGIDAHIYLTFVKLGDILTDDGEIPVDILMNADRMSDYKLCGGEYPVLENEVAVSEYSCRQSGIKIGDVITIRTEEDDPDDPLKTVEVEKEMVVTGFLNYAETAGAHALFSNAYQGGGADYYTGSSFVINAEGKEKEKIFKQIEDLYGEEYVLDEWEFYDRSMSYVTDLFTVIKVVLLVVVVFITALMTSLYSSIFELEERGETALLVTLGTDNKTIVMHKLLRMLILVGVAIVLGTVIMNTFGSVMVRILFDYVKFTDFDFKRDPLTTFAIMPAAMLGSVLIPTLIKVRNISKIKLSDIEAE